jgi:HSP20 family protein
MMNLIRWNGTPVRDLARVHDEMDRLFETLWGSGRLPRRIENEVPFTPAVDVEETADEFVLRADVPGVSQKDVKVTLMGDTLTIRGERRHQSESKEANLHRVERVWGTFERSFTLDGPVRSDKIKATCHEGVLEIRVPKAEEAKVREIEVQVA